MATLIPSRSTCLSRMTSGERRFSSRLDDKFDDEYLCWYDVPVGPQCRHPDLPESAGRRGPIPELWRARNVWAEADIIAGRIQDAITNGANPNDFAVLCHSNRLAGLIATQLQKRGLPVLLASDDQRRAIFNGPASVKVMTMHSSKGLEFDTVFIPGIRELANLEEDAERKQQQVRVLYVAMTRALRQLEMSHHGESVTVKQIRDVLQGGWRRLAA